jgi:serine/threonine protein kinase/Tfp pilus assembly protein PilF
MTGCKEPNRRGQLGDFEIVREIGRGGMGIVYEARQVSLNRKVALKVLSGSLGLSSKAVVRFRREAEAAAKLHHTNIVPIYATGEEDGTHFYAMELIEGPSLNVVIRELRRVGRPRPPRRHEATDTRTNAEPEREAQARETDAQVSPVTDTTSLPPWLLETITSDVTPSHSPIAVSDSSTALTTGGGYFDTIARLVAEVADALDYAHDQGVIHRDIKPSNLLLSPAGRMSINDFGLARMLEQPGMTMTGEFMGSPLYMSPEQIAVGRAPLDHRTDIYSLGATLYELLTLQPPFPGERRDQIIAQIISKEPKPPRRLNKKVPVDLETICLKAMEKDPDRRYQTAGQMAEDLRRFVNRFAISAKRAGPVARSIKWARRRPAVAALAALVVLVAVVASVLAYREQVARNQMITFQRQDALDDAFLAAMSGDFAAAEESIKRAELWGASAARIRMLRGQVALQEGRADEAIDHLEQAVKLLPESVSAHAMLTYACGEDGQIGRFYTLLRNLDELEPITHEDCLFKGLAEAPVFPERALENLDEAVRRRDSAVARLMRAEVGVFRANDTGEPEHAASALEDARRAKGLLPDNPMALFTDLRAQLVAAHVYGQTGQNEKRESCLDEAGHDARVLESFEGFARAHQARAWYFEFVGQNEDALAEWRRGAEAPQASDTIIRGYPAALYRAGRFKEALRALDESGLPKQGAINNMYRLIILAELPNGRAQAVAACRTIAWAELQDLGWHIVPTILRFLGYKSEAMVAARQLRDQIAPMPNWMQGWYRHLLDYDCGDTPAEELVGLAGSSRWKLIEAHFVIGVDILSDGDRHGAAEHFKRCADTYVFDYWEYKWCRPFLERLQQDPKWPPWIPVKEDVVVQSAATEGAGGG